MTLLTSLVLGDISLGLHDGIDSGGHGVGQSLEILRVLGKLPPGLLDGGGQLLQVGGSRVGGDDAFETMPTILNGIEIARLSHPVKNRNICLIQPGQDGSGRVAGCSILHEDGAPSLVKGPPQMPPEDLLVHLGVHFAVGLDEVQLTQLSIAKRGPNHQLGRMLHSPHHAGWVVSGN